MNLAARKSISTHFQSGQLADYIGKPFPSLHGAQRKAVIDGFAELYVRAPQGANGPLHFLEERLHGLQILCAHPYKNPGTRQDQTADLLSRCAPNSAALNSLCNVANTFAQLYENNPGAGLKRWNIFRERASNWYQHLEGKADHFDAIPFLHRVTKDRAYAGTWQDQLELKVATRLMSAGLTVWTPPRFGALITPGPTVVQSEGNPPTVIRTIALPDRATTDLLRSSIGNAVESLRTDYRLAHIPGIEHLRTGIFLAREDIPTDPALTVYPGLTAVTAALSILEAHSLTPNAPRLFGLAYYKVRKDRVGRMRTPYLFPETT